MAIKSRDVQMIIRWLAVLVVLMVFVPIYVQEAKSQEPDPGDGQIRLTWTVPTQNEDGTPLTDLAGFRLYRSTVQGGPYNLFADIPDPDRTRWDDCNLDRGVYYYRATAYNSRNRESVFSGEAFQTVPPTLYVIPEDLRVFTVIKAAGKFLFVAVGSVPEGTRCSNDFTVEGELPNRAGIAQANVVNAADVQWSGSLTTLVPVARCTPPRL